jgi:hypothetical protein
MTPKLTCAFALTLALATPCILTISPAMASPGQPFATQDAVVGLTSTLTDSFETARRGRGADDGAGHTRGGGKTRGRGKDDGPNHTWMEQGPDTLIFARRGRGADDGAGHTRGGGKTRGRGADDAPNHG